MLAVREAAGTRQHAGERRRRRAGGRVLGDAHGRRKHAGVEIVARFGRLPAEHEQGAMRRRGERAVENGAVGRGAADRLQALDRHEGEAVAGRPAARREIAEADVAGRDAQRLRQSRRPAAARPPPPAATADRTSPAPPVARRRHPARHRPDGLFQHHGARFTAAVEAAEQHRGAHGRMAGKRQFALGREDAQARAMRGILRRQHEHRLRQIELARDRLHRRGVEAIALQHDGKRIAGKAPVGEDVEGDKAAFHDRTGLNLQAKRQFDRIAAHRQARQRSI